MKYATKVFLGLLAFLLLNVAFSLSLTFTVPQGVNPFDWFLQAPVQLGMFIATGVVVMVLDFYLMFGGIGQSELLPPLHAVRRLWVHVTPSVPVAVLRTTPCDPRGVGDLL